MSFDWGRKPEYSEETSEAQEEQANSVFTGRVFTPNLIFAGLDLLN